MARVYKFAQKEYGLAAESLLLEGKTLTFNDKSVVTRGDEDGYLIQHTAVGPWAAPITFIISAQKLGNLVSITFGNSSVNTAVQGTATISAPITLNVPLTAALRPKGIVTAVIVAFNPGATPASNLGQALLKPDGTLTITSIAATGTTNNNFAASGTVGFQQFSMTYVVDE